TWAILLYRNYPRDRHYQFFSATLPRGGACFICHSNTLVGLERLPSGGHVVAAPYVSASGEARPRDGLGTPLGSDRVRPHAGLDVKFTPNADNVVDLTVKPDFSQVESDTAQISANERFALFFRKSGRSFWRASICFKRRFRPSTRERLQRRGGGAGSPGNPAACATPRSSRTMAVAAR